MEPKSSTTERGNFFRAHFFAILIFSQFFYGTFRVAFVWSTKTSTFDNFTRHSCKVQPLDVWDNVLNVLETLLSLYWHYLSDEYLLIIITWKNSETWIEELKKLKFALESPSYSVIIWISFIQENKTSNTSDNIVNELEANLNRWKIDKAWGKLKLLTISRGNPQS